MKKDTNYAYVRVFMKTSTKITNTNVSIKDSGAVKTFNNKRDLGGFC